MHFKTLPLEKLQIRYLKKKKRHIVYKAIH